MSQVEITDVDPRTLVDINAIDIDNNLSHEEKVTRFIEQLGNPYCFKSGDVAVRVRFNNDNSLTESLVRYFTRLKQN
jgi:hypothetical protein